MTESVQPGSYNISKLMLHTSSGTPYNILPQLTLFSFIEDMEIPNIKGIVSFIDNTNAFGRTDFDGLETVNAVFKSLGPEDPEIDITFRVFRTDLKTSDDRTKQIITLSLVTPEHYPGSIKEVKNGFVGMTISDMVKTVYDEHIAANVENPKPFNVHETTNSLNIVVPQMSPNEAMYFLRKKAFRQGEFQTSIYHFYEDRDQFNFTNLEQTIVENRKKAIEFNYVPMASYGGKHCEQNEGDIISLNLSPMKDYLLDLKTGLHVSETKEIDILARTYIKKTFKSTDIFKGTKSMDEEARYSDTEEFLNKFVADDVPVSYTIFNDANFTGITDFAINYYGPKLYMHNAFNQVIATARVHGDTTLKPGMMVNLNIPKATAVEEEDEQPYLAGKYLITAVAHNIEGELYSNILTLKKDSYKNNNTDSEKEAVSKEDQGETEEATS